MKIRPILFSTPMVQAITNGTKTQTRRIIKPQPEVGNNYWNWPGPRSQARINSGSIYSQGMNVSPADDFGLNLHAPNRIGDILWVREGFRYVHHYGFEDKFIQYRDASNNAHCNIPDQDQIIPDESGWKPSIFMPKAACRIFLEVTNVRVERLHDISEEDAISEGIENHYLLKREGYKHYTRIDKFIPFGEEDAARTSFFSLWMSINGPESLDENPWVWVYDFKRVSKPKTF